MSSIKLAPNASGTGEFTIAAPNSNTNRTLTLPDVAGTFVTADASGNVGIGTSLPTARLQIGNNVGSAGAANQIRLYESGSSIFGFGVSAGQFDYRGASHVFYSDTGTYRASIDSSGNLLVGASSGNPGARLYLVSDSSPTFIQTVYDTRTDNNSGGGAIGFQRRVGTGSPSFVGSITTSTTSTAYNTSSDYRLKEQVQPMTGALAKVQALKPCTYKWKVDGSDGEGFIAHELAEVVPQCVTGEKDAVDADGNPIYQGIDTSFLVATLTAAIQEQQAMIQTLTARIEALEAK